jgi:hypothetical protein
MEIPAAYEKPAGSEVDFYVIRSPIMHKRNNGLPQFILLSLVVQKRKLVYEFGILAVLGKTSGGGACWFT